jgi:hypothetical protein
MVSSALAKSLGKRKASASSYEPPSQSSKSKKAKRKVDFNSSEDEDDLSDSGSEEEADGVEKKKPYSNKVLILCSRGIQFRQRHLMNDLVELLPHSKKGKSSFV